MFMTEWFSRTSERQDCRRFHPQAGCNPGFRAQGLRVQGLKHARPSIVGASSSKGLGGLLRAYAYRSVL